MKRILGFILFFIVLAVGLAFAVVNAEPVTLKYYFGVSQVPLSLTLVAAFAVGAIMGVVASLAHVLRLKRENARLRREAKMAEREIMNLRNIPIRDVH